MTITYEIQNTTQLRLFKAQKQVNELMELTTSTLYSIGVNPDKLDQLDDDIEYCLSVPFTEQKYNKAIQILKYSIREQIAR